MKTKMTILLTVLLYAYYGNAQQENLGIIVEYSTPINLTYDIYEPPLRIAKVETQAEIDYKNIEGLVQSFYSATDIEWALSDYLAKNATTSRDDGHFNAVKKSDAEENYIQLETVYAFKHQGRQMAYVRYSFIMEQVPFPIIGMMSAEFSEGRWYISTLLNQQDVFTVLSNLEPSVLNNLFTGESDDADINNIIQRTSRNDRFDMFLMGQLYPELNEDESIKAKIKDKRLIVEGYEFRNASISSKPQTYNYIILNPFVLDQAIFSEYANKDKGVINDEKGLKAYENRPEALLLKPAPIDLINNLEFTTQGQTYNLIKYVDGTPKVVLIEENGGTFSLSASNAFDSWKTFFSEIKSDILASIFNKNINDRKLKEIADGVSKPDGGINIDALITYFETNRGDLASYYGDE